MTTSVEASASPAPVLVSPWRGWVVTLAALGINLLAGTLYAWTVIGGELSNKDKPYGWDAQEQNYPFTAATITFALMMIFAGRIQDKIGPRKVALLGGIVLGGGFILASLQLTVLVMTLAFAVVGLGIGLAYSATTPAAIKWFSPTKKGLITGMVVSGVGLAAVYAAPAAQKMLDHGMSISKVLMILGVCTIVGITILSFIISNPPPGYKPKEPNVVTTVQKKNISAKREVNWPEMLKTPQFYLLWIIFVLAASSGLMLISNIKTLAGVIDLRIAKNFKWEYAYLFPVFLAIGNTSGRFVGGFVSDRLGRTNSMILFFLLQAGNMFLFHLYQTHALLVFGVIFTGVCYGTIFTLMPATIADYYGVKNLGVNFGLLFTAFGMAGTVGPILGGAIKKHSPGGNYDTAFIILGCMLLVAVVLVFFTKAPKLATLPAGSSENKA